MDLSKKKIHWTGEEASHCGSVVQVIGLPSVKIVQGLLFYHGLRFPRYLHQTIIVASATVQCFGWTLTEIAARYILLYPAHAYFFPRSV